MMLLTLSVAAQTQDEWNYLTKGLKIQEESGLDMKKGYKLETISSASLPKSTRFLFRYLINDNGKKIGLSVKSTLMSGQVIYFAMPIENFNLWVNEYYNFLSRQTETFLVAYSYALSTVHLYK